MKSTGKYTLRELKESEMPGIFPLIKQLNPTLSKPLFIKRLKAMTALDYHVVAAFDGKKMVALSGFWIGMRFWCGREFDIDNFIVDEKYRGTGIGKLLMVWLEDRARKEGTELIVLDSYASAYDAHAFYHARGYGITGYHFTKAPASGKPFRKTS